jgi:hypothetical protein
MNFQAVAAFKSTGNTTYIQGVLLEIAEQGINKNQKPFMKCKIADNTGQSHKVTIYQSKGGFPTTASIGQNCIWQMSSYDGQYGKQFSGFFGGVAQQGQPNAPQASQKPPQATNAPQVDTNGQIRRMNVLNRVCDLVIAKEITAGNEADTLRAFEKYVIDGTIPEGWQDDQPKEPAYDGSEPTPPDEPAPF